MEIMQREQRLAAMIGEERMETIIRRVEEREAVVNKYMKEGDTFKEWNKMMGKFQNNIQNNWLFAKGNYRDSFKDLVKDVDEVLCEEITKLAGGELLSLCEDSTSRRWKWGIIEKWKSRGMSKENAMDMVTYIVGLREEMCLSLTENIASRFKGYEWMRERTLECQAKEIAIDSKTKIKVGTNVIGNTVIGIVAMTTPMDIQWREAIKDLPKGEYEAGKWYDIKGKFKVKAFSQTSDIVFTDEETRRKLEKYIKKGLKIKAQRENEKMTA